MTSLNRKFLLGELLKSVSRSFYLSLRVLPAGLREPISIAYLLARAADTIADTVLISPEHRIELLLSLRSQVIGPENKAELERIQAEVALQQIDSGERRLLATLKPVIVLLAELDERDRRAVRAVVTTLTMGMEFDLARFPDERSGQIAALKTWDELDHYTYLVAGCVGEFWTELTCAHRPELRDWDVSAMSRCGVRFGKALQMTNILRDCAKDLRMGRCYLPAEMLAGSGLTAEKLLQPEHGPRARELMLALMRQALDHFREAERYTLMIPARCIRLRLACLWPILIGLKTLELHARNDAWLDPKHPSKITRSEIYRIAVYSLPVAGSNLLLRSWVKHLITNIEAQLNSCPASHSRLA